jgi:hypothetical protein
MMKMQEPEATPAEVLEAACPTCSAAPGEPCDGSYYKFFFLGMFVRGFRRVHTARYLARIRSAA